MANTMASIRITLNRTIGAVALGLVVMVAPVSATFIATPNAVAPGSDQIRADIGQLWWIDQISPHVYFPHVDSSVYQSR
jgi:hypothetical protein